MQRRKFIGLLGAMVASSLAAGVQERRKIWRIGMLDTRVNACSCGADEIVVATERLTPGLVSCGPGDVP